MKKILILLLLLYLSYEIISKVPDKSVHLIICDVGQGDAILIQQGYFQALIDTGPDEKVVSCLQKHLPSFDKQIELLVLTHYDNDHIGGFTALSELYDFSQIYTSLTDSKESKVFLELEERFLSLVEQGTSIKQPILGQQMAYSNFSLEYSSPEILFTFITPISLETDWQTRLQAFQAGAKLPEAQKQQQAALEAIFNDSFERKESVNDRSISLLMQYGQLNVFLSGDLEAETELSIVESGLIIPLDILKVAHHGSKTSSTADFLLETRPETALISVGEKNQFGHPAIEVLTRLSQFAHTIARSDSAGELELVLKDDFYYFLN